MRGWRFAGFFSLMLLAGSGSLAAQTVGPRDADAERAARVAELIKQLDANTRRARIDAERELLAIGPAALPYLPAPELLPNVSVRESMRRLRLVLEQQQARDSVQPARVMLPKTAPLMEMVQSIEQQTGNQIDASRLSPETLQQRINAAPEATTFWRALDEIAAQADCVYDEDSADQGVTFIPRSDAAPATMAVAYSGPFRMALDDVGIRPLVGDADFDLLRFQLRLAVEPRLRPLFLDLAVKNAHATLPMTGELAPFSPEARYELPLGEGGRKLRLQLDYRLPVASQATRASLTGKASLLTAAGREEITFTDLRTSIGAARRRGGVTVVLQRADRERQAAGSLTLKIRVAVSYDTGGPAFESHRSWIYHNRVFVKTPDGKSIEPDTYTTTLQADGAVGVEYEFRDITTAFNDLSFVYVAPTLLIDVPLEFDFPSVPITNRPPPQHDADATQDDDAQP